MIYRDLCQNKVSLLGFGTMRFPTVDGEIDFAATEALIARAIEGGVNYFDTAWPYHSGDSERVVGRILEKYPRESYFLATKYPGHQSADTYDPADIFEKQLEKCKTDYFDYYLLHNVYENSLSVYTDPKWGIIDYFINEKKKGRIKHLGFSTHGGVKMIEDFLDSYGEHMEFCQIQFNYLDDTLQNAGEKYKLLTERGIPVIVMEGVRGGKLAKLDESARASLSKCRADVTDASWAFRWLQEYKNVSVILSGMSNMEQLEDNLMTFDSEAPLSKDEKEIICAVAEGMKNSLPCTACRYCIDGCPMELDIPHLISLYNELRYQASFLTAMRLDGYNENKLPSACIGCGACSSICPQKIDIPAALADMTEIMKKLPKWADLCRERAALQR